jgi:hypothetical protein
MRIAPFVSLLFITSGSALASPTDDIQGTWQLLEVVVSSLADSNPRGIPAVKEHYSADGRLYFIAPTAVMDSKTQWASYQIEGSRRTVRIGNGPPYVATIAFSGPDELIVTQRAGDRWRYRRLKGNEAPNQRIEPLSVEVLKTKGGDQQAATEYDTRDYSALPPDKRLVGVWEVIARGNVLRQEAPPYGFLNDVWVFDGSMVSTTIRAKSNAQPLAKRTYAVRGDTVDIESGSSKGASIHMSFNSWGHLVLDFKGRNTVTLKLISKAASDNPPLPPIKIVLLHLQGETRDP